jgi:acylphosphatase
MRATVCHADVHYGGRVQGVGFRFQVLQIAGGYAVSGYVRNLADGRVRLEAEGAEAELRAFLAEVRSRLRAYIRQFEQVDGRRPQQFSGFTIA